MTIPATTILVTRNGMGQSDPALQTKLIQTYFRLLDESDTLPGVIAFYTEGVFLVCEDSPVLDSLASLEAKGVRLVICNTCLNFFNLVDKVVVGIPGSMTDIIEAQFRAEKVIAI